jgi:hypothetical protein
MQHRNARKQLGRTKASTPTAVKQTKIAVVTAKGLSQQLKLQIKLLTSS